MSCSLCGGITSDILLLAAGQILGPLIRRTPSQNKAISRAPDDDSDMQLQCDFTNTLCTIIMNHIVSRCVSEVCTRPGVSGRREHGTYFPTPSLLAGIRVGFITLPGISRLFSKFQLYTYQQEYAVSTSQINSSEIEFKTDRAFKKNSTLINSYH